MCGLFGLLRSPLAAHPEWASDALVTLGTLAEERGTDSAGIALLTGRPATAARPPAPGETGDRYSDLDHGGCRIVKGRDRFAAVWRLDLLPTLDRAPIAFGHTRWATQGTPHSLANASPLVVPGPAAGIIATHNGDVEAAELRARHRLPAAAGTTDSEPVFQALAACDDTGAITGVLSSLVGRAALAWVERDRPDRVHLARAALSPLAVAVDTEHNLYWASNPRWFRDVERYTRVRFATAVMLREGTYLRLGSDPAAPSRVLDRADFTPTARSWDLDDRVWTGFTAADRELDRAGLRHRVVRRGPCVDGPGGGPGGGEFAAA
ncbi:class II glutamine amidotransferase [Spirillospora sp. CA-253888]